MIRLPSCLIVTLTLLSLLASPGVADEALPDTLFLTWSRDPTTTMDVQWLEQAPRDEGDDDEAERADVLTYQALPPDARAEGAQEATVESLDIPDADYRLRLARLTDLEPDTRYRVTLDGADFEFLTAPAKLDRPLVFAEGGDIGTGPDVPALHRIAASWDPLFGSVGGDIAYADGKGLLEVDGLSPYVAQRDAGGGWSADPPDRRHRQPRSPRRVRRGPGPGPVLPRALWPTLRGAPLRHARCGRRCVAGAAGQRPHHRGGG